MRRVPQLRAHLYGDLIVIVLHQNQLRIRSSYEPIQPISYKLIFDSFSLSLLCLFSPLLLFLAGGIITSSV